MQSAKSFVKCASKITREICQHPTKFWNN